MHRKKNRIVASSSHRLCHPHQHRHVCLFFTTLAAFTMEQDADSSPLTTVSAPAGEKDTAELAELAVPGSARLESAPQSPCSSDSEYGCCCCGHDPRVPVYQLWIPDYEHGPWDLDASDPNTEPDVSLRETVRQERALRQWHMCVHTH